MDSNLIRKALFFVLIYLKLIFETDSADHKLQVERGSVTYCNNNYLRNLKFGYTRPDDFNVIVSASYDVIKNDIGDDCYITIDIHRYVGTKWKRVPVKLSSNLCEMLKQNLYIKGLQELLKHGNATACNTNYYIKDYMPVLAFPPIVPRGRYKLNANIKLKDDTVITMEWLAKILD